MRNETLYVRDERGDFIPAAPAAVLAGAKAHLSHRVRRGTLLTSPTATRDFLILKLGDREFETFCCLFLDLCGLP
jgi:DNA repair protein RadC